MNNEATDKMIIGLQSIDYGSCQKIAIEKRFKILSGANL